MIQEVTGAQKVHWKKWSARRDGQEGFHAIQIFNLTAGCPLCEPGLTTSQAQRDGLHRLHRQPACQNISDQIHRLS